MQRQKKKKQKKSLDKEISQQDLIVGLAVADVVNSMNELYEGSKVSIIISVPAKLLEQLNAMYPHLTGNRSLFLSFVLHQGKTRMIEKYAIES